VKAAPFDETKNKRVAAKILKAAIGRVADTHEDLQEAIVRVVFSAQIAGLGDAAILRAFLGAWPFVSESKLRCNVTWPRPKKPATAKKATPKKGEK